MNKPEIPTVPTNVSAFTNDANYITSADVPAQVNADWNATSGAGQILNKPELFSGNYNDLANKPEIPTVPTNVSAFTNDANYITSADVPAQVNADWNAISGAGQILNKPEIPTVPTNVSAFTNDANYITSADVPAQVNADWNATSGAGQILNKPEIPTVPTNVSAFENDANYLIASDLQTIQNNITALQIDTIQTLREEMGNLMDSIRVLQQSLNELTTLVSTLNIQMEQELFVATEGQTAFSLQHAPKPTCIIRCYVNGVMVGSDRSGLLEIDNENPSQINYYATANRNYSLKDNDKITIVYWY